MPTRNAVEYTLRHLVKVAFPNVQCAISTDGNRVCAQVADLRFIFPLIDKESFQKMVTGQLPAELLQSPTGNLVPAFRRLPNEGTYFIDNDEIVICYDLITLSFLMLSRAEEMFTEERDVHGRYQFKNSLASRYDFIDFPIVDEYAMILRSIAKEECPDMQIVERKPSFISTHDIDLVNRFGGGFSNLRTLAADLFKYKSWSIFATSFAQYRDYRRDELKDPYILSAEMLLERDLKENRQSLFFFKSLRKGEEDFTYDIFGTQAGHLIRMIEGLGGEVGLHGSYPSFNNLPGFSKEKIYLENVTEHPIFSGRQHYLRFDVRTTPIIWQDVELKDDYTLGFAEREGFRCGTCHPYPLYDVQNDVELQVMEHPLIAMDGTFFQYQQNTKEEALQKIRKLQTTCEAVEGDFILLWHNTFVWREFAPWYEGVFCKL